MDTIRLRILTRKSKFDGKYGDLTVGEILNLKKYSYLRYCYYHYSAISFTDDILEEIGVINEKHDDRIQKPGTNPELFEKLGIIYKSHGLDNIIGKNIHKQRNIAKAVAYYKRDELKFKSGKMAWKNQGH